MVALLGNENVCEGLKPRDGVALKYRVSNSVGKGGFEVRGCDCVGEEDQLKSTLTVRDTGLHQNLAAS